MDTDNNTSAIAPDKSDKSALSARIARYVGWLIVAAKIIEPTYFSYIYLDVLRFDYILSTIALKSTPWIFFGLSIVQAGRWIDRGDNTQLAAGKLLQVLGLGAIIFMLMFFVPGYIKTEADKSIALYSGFYLLIGGTILITALCMIFLGALLKRMASKLSLISFGVICVVLIFVSLRMLS
ncbi:hypothetical protein [Paramagnetospirillum magnetotacticum]|uniref:hypothetical protein n=1 Tax=Paramagnetospirillum magnetotacticum TaxID=188 RepID=UPI00126A1211|nr:hypothetical protein [Paramagnetospirillum magnetotacticum]